MKLIKTMKHSIRPKFFIVRLIIADTRAKIEEIMENNHYCFIGLPPNSERFVLAVWKITNRKLNF